MVHNQATLAATRRAFLKQLGLPFTSASAAHAASFPVSQPPLNTSRLAPPSAAILAYTRMGFGPRPGDIEAFNALGATDDARLEAYIEQQLNPDTIDDSECDSRLAALDTLTLDKTLTELWTEHMTGDMSSDYLHRMRPYWDTECATFVRAIHSKRQLNEVITDFWHNHFNVQGSHWETGPVWVHYDRDIIRGHMWGNFRQMLEAVATSPAMLIYLDNESNTRAGPNENFARELFELHGMGAENYLGAIPQEEWVDPITQFPIVPEDGEGYPLGYIDYDVYEATRCFTGWSLDSATGAFVFNEDDHDRFAKFLLRTYIPPDQQAATDGQTVIDLIAINPGTARYICRKLCQRLISDNPPNSLVQSATAVFRAQQDAPDQLKQVVRHILLSDAFRTTWGEKVKRPFELITSAARAIQFDLSFRQDDSDSDNFFWLYNQAGQGLFQWPAPNGYPDVKEAWQSTTPIVMSWRLINWMVEMSENYEGATYYADIFGQTPAHIRDATNLTDFWVDRILHRPLDSTTHQRLTDFMAQEYAADEDLPLDNPEWPGPDVRSRLRSLVGLILLLPEFQER